MSRSTKENWIVDGANKPKTKHQAKKKAARAARHAENTKLSVLAEDYIEQPSIAYTNPYDISDYRFPTDDIKHSRK